MASVSKKSSLRRTMNGTDPNVMSEWGRREGLGQERPQSGPACRLPFNDDAIQGKEDVCEYKVCAKTISKSTTLSLFQPESLSESESGTIRTSLKSGKSSKS